MDGVTEICFEVPRRPRQGNAVEVGEAGTLLGAQGIVQRVMVPALVGFSSTVSFPPNRLQGGPRTLRRPLQSLLDGACRFVDTACCLA